MKWGAGLWGWVAYGYLHSQTEIEDTCSFQDAEATSPQLAPGESVTEKLHSAFGKNYLAPYFNANDTSLTNSELQHYLVDIWPTWLFLFLSLVALCLWTSYCFCVGMRCCYCLLGPATKSVTTRKRRIPYVMGLTFGVVCLGLVPVTIYYSTQLYRNILYLRCASLRFSGGYYYGYKSWVGLTALNTSGEELIRRFTEESASINTTLYPYYSDPGKAIGQEAAKIEAVVDLYTKKWLSISKQTLRLSRTLVRPLPPPSLKLTSAPGASACGAHSPRSSQNCTSSSSPTPNSASKHFTPLTQH